MLFALLGVACGKTSREGHPAGAYDAGNDAGNDAGGEGPMAGGASGSDLAGMGGVDDLSSVDLTGAPLYTRAQRLTNSQWENAVTDILHFDERHGLSANFKPPPSGLSAFDNNERILFVNQQTFVDFEAGAEAAASIATGSPAALAALYDGDDVASFVRVLGRRAFRRPLSAAEETKYQKLFALGEQLYGSGFANGAALVIRGMLQSPYFLYRTELGPAGDELNPYELASKLSFWLLGTTPSDSLLDAAEAGKLSKTAGLVATARDMLEDARAASMMRDFLGQLLFVPWFKGLDFKNLSPAYDPSINPELALASNAFFDRIFGENLGLRELLTSQQAYVSARLAPFYGLKVPAGSLQLRDVGPSRSGYFMQVPFLMLGNYDSVPMPSLRGQLLEAAVLCAARGPGPDTQHTHHFVPAPDNETNRQYVSALTASCGGACHRAIDGLGFAFEKFDGLGRQRELDNGLSIDTSGSYPFAEGEQHFADGNELMQVLAGSTQVHTCYSKQLTSYALGRDMMETDRPLLEALAEVSQAHSFKEVILAFVQDPAFHSRKAGLP